MEGRAHDTVNNLESAEGDEAHYRLVDTDILLIGGDPINTDDVPEGATNLYFTEARVGDTWDAKYTTARATAASWSGIQTYTQNLIAPGINNPTGLINLGGVGSGVRVLDTAASTDAGTGALVVAGGLGVGGAINTTGDIFADGFDANGVGPLYIGTGVATSVVVASAGVPTVFGDTIDCTGVLVGGSAITTSDVLEGTNLYYTAARWATAYTAELSVAHTWIAAQTFDSLKASSLQRASYGAIDIGTSATGGDITIGRPSQTLNLPGTVVFSVISATGGQLDNVAIGPNVPAVGTFTTLTSTGVIYTNSVQPRITGTLNIGTEPVGQTPQPIGLGSVGYPLTIFSDTFMYHADIGAGTIDNVVIGGASPTSGTFDILAATIYFNTPAIGTITPGTGAFTTLVAASLRNPAGALVLSGTAGDSTFIGAGSGGGAVITLSDTVLGTDGTQSNSPNTGAIRTQGGIGAQGNIYAAGKISTGYDFIGPIGDTTPAAGTFSTMTSSNVVITGGTINSTPIGQSGGAAGNFTTLNSTSLLTTAAITAGTALVAGTTVSANTTITAGTDFIGPIGGTTPAAGAFTTLSASSGINSTAIGATTASTGYFTTLRYAPVWGRWTYTLVKSAAGGDKVGDESWAFVSPGPPVVINGTSILADYWFRHPINTTDTGVSWCTMTACGTGTSTTASSLLVDAGSYRVSISCNDLYSGRRMIVLTDWNITRTALPLAGTTYLRGVNNYGGHSTDPGDCLSVISGYITLASQTRLYIMKNQSIVSSVYAVGTQMDRPNLVEVHAEIILEKIS